MEYWWNFSNGMEWNTENLEQYWNIQSIFRNIIRILEKGEILRKFPENGNRVIFRNTEVMSGKKTKQLLFLPDQIYILKEITNMHCAKVKEYLKWISLEVYFTLVFSLRFSIPAILNGILSFWNGMEWNIEYYKKQREYRFTYSIAGLPASNPAFADV